MPLDKWIQTPRPLPKPLSTTEAKAYYDSFQRGRKLRGLMEKHPNLHIEFINGMLRDDEWYYIVDVRIHPVAITLVAYALHTTNKAQAVRRVYGWGLRNEKGPVWPLNTDFDGPDELHVQDVDETTYSYYWRS